MTHQETPMERVCQGRKGDARVKMVVERDEGEGRGGEEFGERKGGMGRSWRRGKEEGR